MNTATLHWPPRHISRYFLLLALGFIATAAGGWLTPSIAQTSSQANSARIRQILDGNQVYIQNRQAVVGNVANRNQQIRTEQARTELQFDTGLVGRLTQYSSLTVGQSCVQVRRGTLLISGGTNSCSSRVTAGVRGTIYTMTVSEAGTTEVMVLEGTVDISLTDDASNQTNKHIPEFLSHPHIAAIPLEEGLQISIDADGRLQAIEPVSAETFTAILTGPLMTDFSEPLPGQDKLQTSFERLYPGVEFPGFPELGSTSNGGSSEANLSAACLQAVNNYRQTIRTLVEVQWDPPTPPTKGVWQTILDYEVTRNGTVQNIEVQTSSGYIPFDDSTIASAQQLEFPPFPECFSGDVLEINHRFELLYE